MTQFEICLSHAEAQRTAAAATSLPNRREMHLRSAEAWETMASSLRDTAGRARANEAAKAAIKGSL